VKVLDSFIGALEFTETEEGVALARTVVVASDLGQIGDTSEVAESVVENLLVDHGVQVTNEQVGADLVRLLLVGGGLIDTEILAVELDSVDAFGGVVGIFSRSEFDKAKTLMRLGDSVAGHMDILDRAHLDHDLVNHGGGGPFVDVSDVDGSIFVLLPVKKSQPRIPISRYAAVGIQVPGGITYQWRFCAMMDVGKGTPGPAWEVQRCEKEKRDLYFEVIDQERSSPSPPLMFFLLLFTPKFKVK
jgi:hypothetical protein